MRRHLPQRSPEICRGLVPEAVNLRADDRPVLHALRRRRNGQAARTELARELLQAIDQANSKPCDRADDDQQIDDRDDQWPPASAGRPDASDSQLYGGYKATVRTMLQASMGMNGRTRTNDQ